MNASLSETSIQCFCKYLFEVQQEENFNPVVHHLLVTFLLVLGNTRHTHK